VIQVHEDVRVLIIDGAPNSREPEKAASFNLAWALRPASVEVHAPDAASPRQLANKNLCVLVDVSLEPNARAGRLSGGFLATLGAFVRSGNSLMVFAGNQVNAETYNRVLFEQKLLPVKLAGVETSPDDKPWSLTRGSAVGPFARFQQDPAYQSLEKLEV